MAGPNFTIISGDWQSVEYAINDLCSRIINEDRSFTDYILHDGSRAFTGNQSMGSHRLTSLLDPTADKDAATKIYVDDTLITALEDYIPYVGAIDDIDLGAHTVVMSGTGSIMFQSTATTGIAIKGINTSTSAAIYGISGSSYGLKGDSTDGIGAAGASINNIGVQGWSTNSVGVYGYTSNGDYGAESIVNPVSTTGLRSAFLIERRSQGTAQDGIGGILEFRLQNTTGGSPYPLSNEITSRFTNATAGSETSEMGFTARTGGGATIEIMNISNIGLTLAQGIHIRPTSDNLDAFSITLADGTTKLIQFDTNTYGEILKNQFYFKPDADAANAIKFTNADSSVGVLALDTANIRVGIGRSNPSYTLDVYCASDDAGMIVQTASNDKSAYIGVYNSGDTSGNTFQLRCYGSGEAGTIFGVNIADAGVIWNRYSSSFLIGTIDAVDIVFGTNDTERLRIAGNGTITIGSLGGLLKCTAGVLSTITDSSANWDIAYGWGNHSLAGYLTSVSGQDHSLLSNLDYASAGHTGFSPDTHNHDGVYSLIDHNHSGVYQPLDADLTAIAALGFTSTAFLKKTAADTWELDTNTYLTSEIDPVFSASPAAGIIADDISNWDTAYGWGNHASAGYLKNIVEDLSPQLGANLDGQLTYNLTNMVGGTFSGVVQAEQLTSTDDITMQGHLLTLGNDTANDVVISFKGDANDATITFDESDDEFDYGDAKITTTGVITGGDNSIFGPADYTLKIGKDTIRGMHLITLNPDSNGLNIGIFKGGIWTTPRSDNDMSNFANYNSDLTKAYFFNWYPPSDTVNLDFYGFIEPVLNICDSATALPVKVQTSGFFVDEGRAVVTSQFNKTSDTDLANITGLTINLEAGKTYIFRACMFVNSGSGGWKFAVSGTCTATSIMFELSSTTDGYYNVDYKRIAALDTSYGKTLSNNTQRIWFEGCIVVNAAGTLTIQFAQNASNETASSVLINSFMQVWEV